MSESVPKSMEKLRYEQAVAELEAIVDKVESGEMGLEESLLQYERGMKLIAHCRSILDRSQTRIRELVRQAQGRLEVQGQDNPPDDGPAADLPAQGGPHQDQP